MNDKGTDEIIKRSEIIIKKEKRKLTKTEIIILVISAIIIGTGLGFLLVYLFLTR